MLGLTMLRVVSQQCCVRWHGLLSNCDVNVDEDGFWNFNLQNRFPFFCLCSSFVLFNFTSDIV